MAREAAKGSDVAPAERSSSRLRGAWLNLLLLGASGLVALVGLELALRLFPGLLGEEAALRVHWVAVAGDTDASGQEMMVDDGEVGFLYRPGLEGRIARGDLDFSFRLDSRGFRNPEPWPDRARIVILGDSMAFGYGAPDDAAWPALLRSRLVDGGLVNLGLIGSGPLQQERVYARFGASLRPALVLLTLFPGNDADDDRAFARWQEHGGEGSYRRFRGQGDRWLDDSLLGLAQRTHLFWFAADLTKTLAQRSRGRTLILDDGSPLQLVLPRPGGIDAVDLDRTIGAVERLRARVEADGGTLLVALMPTKEEVYLRLVEDAGPGPSAAFARRLERLGVETLDLGESLRERASRSGPPLYFAVDGHPNPAGQVIIAEAVHRWIEERAPRVARGVSARAAVVDGGARDGR